MSDTSMDQSTRDALADAETLREIKSDIGGVERLRGRRRRWHMTLLGQAERYGSSAAAYTDPTCYHGETSAPYFARRAAHAAFRAVPALREAQR